MVEQVGREYKVQFWPTQLKRNTLAWQLHMFMFVWMSILYACFNLRVLRNVNKRRLFEAPVFIKTMFLVVLNVKQHYLKIFHMKKDLIPTFNRCISPNLRSSFFAVLKSISFKTNYTTRCKFIFRAQFLWMIFAKHILWRAW